MKASGGGRTRDLALTKGGTFRKSSQNPEEFLADFEKTCKVAWDLADSTVNRHVRTAKRLIDFLDAHPLKATRSDILNFLDEYEFADVRKSIRVIYGRYFDTNLASDVKIPQYNPEPKQIPDRKVLKETFHNLPDLDYKTAFLIYASSGLRRSELCSLSVDDVDFNIRMITPPNRSSTKTAWVTFYNLEAENCLKELGELPTHYPDTYTSVFSEASDGKITPQILREWFCKEMGSRGVQDRYIDAFCGRVPQSVLANHYTDFSPERLREVYEKASLKVLES